MIKGIFQTTKKRKKKEIWYYIASLKYIQRYILYLTIISKIRTLLPIYLNWCCFSSQSVFVWLIVMETFNLGPP